MNKIKFVNQSDLYTATEEIWTKAKEAFSGGGGGGSQQLADWDQSDNTAVDYIKNKPTTADIAANLTTLGYALTDTTYTAGTGLTLSGTEFSLSTSGVTAGSYGPSANVDGTNGTTMSVPYITVDSYGRVTSIDNKTYTSRDTDTTYSASTGLSLSGTAFSVVYGSSAGTACQGNDSRLSNSRPASDVYSWAKASSKPSYSWSEISSKPTILTKTTGIATIKTGKSSNNSTVYFACVSMANSTARSIAGFNFIPTTCNLYANGAFAWLSSHTLFGVTITNSWVCCYSSTNPGTVYYSYVS